MRRQVIPFDLVDEAGRELGAYVVTWEEPGTFFASVRRSRDGKHYGRCPTPSRFRTEAERDAHVRAEVERLHLGDNISRILLQKLLALVD